MVEASTQNDDFASATISRTVIAHELQITLKAPVALTFTTTERERSSRLSISAEQQPHGEQNLKIAENIEVHLKQKICRGTKVFKGYHHGRNEDVVVKLIPYFTSDNEREVENLKIASEHENVVTYHSYGWCEYKGQKAIYIVMEMCDSDNLNTMINDNKMPEKMEDKTAIMEELAKGVIFIHDSDILHRDLKPHNVLHKKGKFKISDFGLSKRLPPGKSSTPKTMADLGTDGWRAPETSDEEEPAGKFSDVYSLGLIYYYILTNGKHPFGDAQNGWHKVQNCIRDRDKNSRTKNLDGLDKLLDGRLMKDLLDMMLEFEPEGRPKMQSVIVHPMFWSLDKKWQFYECIIKYRDALVQQRKTQQQQPQPDRLPIWPEFDNKGTKYGENVLPAGEWGKSFELSPEEQTKLKAQPKALASKISSGFDTTSVLDLIRFVRNRLVHLLQDCVGGMTDSRTMLKEELWELISKETRFPYLFVYAFHKIRGLVQEESCDGNLKQLFKDYFPDIIC